jgi:flagellar assembly protein FliH
MQSLYSVIKKGNVVSNGNKEIKTEVHIYKQQDINEENDNQSTERNDEINAKSEIESYERLVKIMLENARKQSEEIISKAYEEARIIEVETFNKAYAEGKEQGYRDAYEENLPEAQQLSQQLIDNANEILRNAKTQYEEYLDAKKDEIINFSIHIAQHILKRELSSRDGLNELIYEAIKNSRNAESFIIRTNSLYVDEIRTNIMDWKERLGLKAEVFVVEDRSIQEGNAIIEKDNGRIEVGIDTAFNNIKEELF